MANTSSILSFYDILIRQSDIELLEGPYWLNDTIISFYFEYLEKVVFKNAKELLFVSPEVTQCIKMVRLEEIKTFLDPLDISRKRFVFFPLNDNQSIDSGGSHWSLVVYSKGEKCFFHFDSSSASNHDVAWDFSGHLFPYLVSDGYHKPLEYARGQLSFVNKDCQQQSNGYDCGVHVISNCERLAEHAHTHGDIGSCNMTHNINPSSKRKEIMNIIKKLSK